MLLGSSVNPSRRSKYLLYSAKPIYVICRDFVLVRFGPLAAEAENFGATLVLSSLGRSFPRFLPRGLRQSHPIQKPIRLVCGTDIFEFGPTELVLFEKLRHLVERWTILFVNLTAQLFQKNTF